MKIFKDDLLQLSRNPGVGCCLVSGHEGVSSSSAESGMAKSGMANHPWEPFRTHAVSVKSPHAVLAREAQSKANQTSMSAS
ncbi:hypothetical protein [Bradyrhizobium sp. OAE829]|uniref:hypothetical protein n=1 Tax=Bradyrhizobium sp. OAE829 TaxID=2663807 RepID=UPI00178B4101